MMISLLARIRRRQLKWVWGDHCRALRGFSLVTEPLEEILGGGFSVLTLVVDLVILVRDVVEKSEKNEQSDEHFSTDCQTPLDCIVVLVIVRPD